MPHIFVHDRDTGDTELVSVGPDDIQGNSSSYLPAISGNGRYVAFFSSASNLVDGDDNGWGDIFVHDRDTGITELVSVGPDGIQGNNQTTLHGCAISAEGRYVSFTSWASNLVPGGTSGRAHVFVRDRHGGITELGSVNSAGVQGNNYSTAQAVSADGRYVAFASSASNLVDGDDNGRHDVFVRDRLMATAVIDGDVDGNLEPGPDDVVLVTNGATVSGNVDADGATVIVEGGSTIEGNLDATNGATIKIRDGSNVDGDVNVDGGGITVNGSTVGGNVEGTAGATVVVSGSTVDDSVITKDCESVTAVHNTVGRGIESTNDGAVTVSDNTVGGNIEIASPITSCTESGNAVTGINSGCP
jgi:hypothetical protein